MRDYDWRMPVAVQAKYKTVDQDVLEVLSTGEIIGNVFVIGGQLERKHYEAVNAVLTELGGKWNRKLKGHAFGSPPDEAIRAVIDSGSIADTSHLGFFATPPALARTLVSLADVRPGHECLEPSAGNGNIARELAAIVGWEHLDLCEIDAGRCVDHLDPLPARSTWQGDFLEQTYEGYDRIVMNPPFAQGQDIRHIRHAFDALAPGGVLVSVMMQSVIWRKDKRSTIFRQFVDSYGELEKLPDGSFADSGTGVHTAVVRLVRP
jgi:hypothetical protein